MIPPWLKAGLAEGAADIVGCGLFPPRTGPPALQFVIRKVADMRFQVGLGGFIGFFGFLREEG